jgi:ribulose-phosphate 3-epimerase
MSDAPMQRPPRDWLDRLPEDRLLAEMSLWSADLGRLAEDMRRVEPFTDLFHVDVADGHFAPALLLFPDLVAVARRVTAKPIHVHLMVADAVLASQVEQFAEAGADLISVHAEHQGAPAALDWIARRGLQAGVVLQLDSPVSRAAPFVSQIAMLTLLGTRFGVKGQDLATDAQSRLREAQVLLATERRKRRVVLAADGGIREHTVPVLREAGAETIVMGSLAFGARDLEQRMTWVHAQPKRL